jgi:NIPSNAP
LIARARTLSLIDPMTLASPIVEFRRYKLRPGARETLIELFERELIESQEADGMTLIGQFREVANPDLFTWLRGFPSMSRRAATLERFYSGPVWSAHRAEANATMLDVDDVLLLRPARPDSAFRLEGERAEIGSEQSSSGVIEATILHLEDSPESNGAVSFFESAIAAALEGAGGTVLGYFLTDKSPNNYPGLPIREDANVLAYFTGFPDCRRLEDRVVVDEAPGLARPPEVFVLEPTSRALLRASSPACPIPTRRSGDAS